MPFSLTPRWVFQHYSEITPDWLRQQGITLLLSDLDFTLAAKKTRRPDSPLRDWIAALLQCGDRFHDRLQQPLRQPGDGVLRRTWGCLIRAVQESPVPGAWRPPWHGLGRTGSAPPCWGQAADGYAGRQPGRSPASDGGAGGAAP